MIYFHHNILAAYNHFFLAGALGLGASTAPPMFIKSICYYVSDGNRSEGITIDGPLPYPAAGEATFCDGGDTGGKLDLGPKNLIEGVYPILNADLLIRNMINIIVYYLPNINKLKTLSYKNHLTP